MARLAELDHRLRSLALLALGAALSTIHPMLSFFPALLFAVPAAFLFLLTASTPKRAAFDGWLLGFGYFLPGLSWISSAFFVEADKFAWMTPFAITLLPAFLATFWAAAFWGARRVGRGDLVSTALALTLFWPLAEYLRGHLFTGFPWGLFAYAWIDTPLAQWSAYVGPYGLTALTVAVAVAIGAAIAASGRARMLWGGGAVAALVLMTAVGALRMPAEPAAGSGQFARIVQPNVPQTEKWRPDLINRNMRWLLELSESPVEPGRAPDMIIWPETAVIPQVLRDGDVLTRLMARLPGAAPLIVGTQRREDRPDGERDWYNSLFVVGDSGAVEAVYDKHHLVPFGEYLPLQGLLESVGIRQIAGRSGGFASGPGPQVVSAPGLPKFGALICYEAVFPTEMPNAPDRPDLLIQITNDAWFGDSGGPRQHLVQARFRAIEQGLPFLRSANTGISAAIDPYGRITDELPLLRQGVLDVEIASPLRPTPYVSFGDIVFALLNTVVLAALIFRRNILRL